MNVGLLEMNVVLLEMNVGLLENFSKLLIRL